MKKMIHLFIIFFSLASPLYGAIDLAQFNQITNELQLEYAPDMRAIGLKFIINKQWENSQKDAGIKIPKGEAILTITGGMAREELMSEDALRLLLCHEIGHVLGGAPKISPGHWSSSEGQADYFATAKCIKRIIPENENRSQRVRKASFALAKILAINNGKSHASVSLEKNDLSRVNTTYAGHPNAQCRLDTMIAGLECPVPFTEEFSSSNPNQGACLRSSTHPQESNNARPRCWYRPPVKRLTCSSVAKLQQYGGKIPLLTAYLDDKRDDQSIEVQLGLAIINPLVAPRERASSNNDDSLIEHSSFIFRKKSPSQYLLTVKKELIEELKSFSLIPIKWDEVLWEFDSEKNMSLFLDCQES